MKKNRAVLFRSFVLRTAFAVFLWWTLAGGRFEEPFFIALLIAVSVACSYALIPFRSWRWHTRGVFEFVPFFLWHSLLGGLDVARRALDPRMPLKPEIIDFTFQCSPTQSLVLAWSTSLLPGTASVQLTESHLKIHVLDAGLPTTEVIKELERRIIRVCD